MSAKVSESSTQRLILDWLSANKIWSKRLNTGAVKASYNGKSRFVRFGCKGMADILAVKTEWVSEREMTYGAKDLYIEVIQRPVFNKLYWLEVKAPKGVQSPDQKSFQSEVEAQGMKYILARSLEDVIEGLK